MLCQKSKFQLGDKAFCAGGDLNSFNKFFVTAQSELHFYSDV